MQLRSPDRNIIFIIGLIIAALTYASGQVGEPPLEKGRLEDLRDAIRVYVCTSLPTKLTIAETIRKKLPQITFVETREEADIWLLCSAETYTQTEITPSLDARSSTTVIRNLRFKGTIIRFQRPNSTKLVKKFSATGKSTDGNKLAKDFAEEFINLYREANPSKQSPAPHPDPPETGPSDLTVTGAADDETAVLLGSSQELALEAGTIQDLKGVTRVYVGAPDHYSSLFLRSVVDTIRTEIPSLVFVWSKEDADILLLLFAAGNVRDTTVRGRIVRAIGPGRVRLVKQYSADGNKAAEGFAREFVKSYRKANPILPAVVARPQQPTNSGPPHLKMGDPMNGNPGVTSAANARNSDDLNNGDTLRTDISLVTILANVVGQNGKPAPDLHQEDFSIYEDNVKQSIAFFEPIERPFTVVLLVDSSISVEADLREIVKAAKVLIERLGPDDQLVIITFDAMVQEILNLTKVRDLRGESIKISPQGGTRLYDAVDFAASKYLERLPGRKAVVLLTDGVDLGSFMTTAEGSLHEVEEYDALFYTLQYKTSEFRPSPAGKTEQEYKRATAYLQALAEKTGGRYYRAENMGELSPAFASIVKELSYQYSLGYYPARPPQPGERRQIRVLVSRPDVVVHTRNSYISKSPPAKQAEPR